MADQHSVYSIFSGDKVIDERGYYQSNSLTTWKLTYKEAYGDGIVLNLAWVKNGNLYTHNENIGRPMPDRHLNVKWTTFRNLCYWTEGEWTLQCMLSRRKASKGAAYGNTLRQES